ncbi:thiol-disulfide oxidoreductase DCC family protein [Halomonadaceae bacterium KBTZ08]
MNRPESRLVVYYDGSCPVCIRDRRLYERLAGRGGRNLVWFDITGQEAALRARGIDPELALQELHVEDGQGRIHSEMAAYILLMRHVPLLRPLAWLLSLGPIKRPVSALYHRWVQRRLAREGRLPPSRKEP